jgi:3-deoxy-7-phosphoheptulonate synthase
MRAYLEKPRTTVGWKGFVYDPSLNGDGDLASGLRRSRALLCRLARLRIPLATEILEPLTVPYLEDCFSWAAIGARTTESQVHRQLVSGLSFPVGFKNGTDGNVQVALAAVKAAAEPHTLLGVDADGRVAVTRTQGNRATHVILRGSSAGPNYSESSVTQLLSSVPQPGRLRLLIDCAHGNSGKDPSKQIHAAQAVSAQFSRSDVDILGLMLESHVSGGSQPVSPNASPHTSVTDPCLGFEQTAQILEELAIAAKRATRTAERPSATHGDYPSMRASRIQA